MRPRSAETSEPAWVKRKMLSMNNNTSLPSSSRKYSAAVSAEVAETVPEKPLPTLDDSDDPVRQDLYTLAARQALDSLLNLNRIIRRFVVTVDNLPRRHLLNSKHRSNQAVPGQLLVHQDGNGYFLSEENYARYAAFITLLESINTDQMIALYLHYYPLIQAAYEDLGYPSAYFNDRLIDVIDHLLETPEVGGRISLVRPHVLYKYADAELEALLTKTSMFPIAFIAFCAKSPTAAASDKSAGKSR